MTPARTSASGLPAPASGATGGGSVTAPSSSGRVGGAAPSTRGPRGRGPRHRRGRGRRSAWPGRATGPDRGRTRGRAVSRGARVMAGRLGGGAEDLDGGPGPFGVHVVDGDRGDAAPVVDAGGEERRRGRRTGWAAPGGGRRRGGSAGPRRWSRPARRSGRAARCAWPCPAWAGSSGRSPPGCGRRSDGSRRWR